MKTRVDNGQEETSGNCTKGNRLFEPMRGFLAGRSRNRGIWRGLAISLMATSLFLAGCDDDDYDYSPPDGLGAIVIDNNGHRDLHVFIDGIYMEEVRDGHWKAFDREPGVYRVVLDESGSDRIYRADIDVLAGQLTVLYVSSSSSVFDNDLDVSVSFD